MTPIVSISVQYSRRDFSDTAKCSQWSHLYESYNTTYALKLSLSEVIAKTEFRSRMVKDQSDIKIFAVNILLYLNSLYGLPGRMQKISKRKMGAVKKN